MSTKPDPTRHDTGASGSVNVATSPPITSAPMTATAQPQSERGEDEPIIDGDTEQT